MLCDHNVSICKMLYQVLITINVLTLQYFKYSMCLQLVCLWCAGRTCSCYTLVHCNDYTWCIPCDEHLLILVLLFSSVSAILQQEMQSSCSKCLYHVRIVKDACVLNVCILVTQAVCLQLVVAATQRINFGHNYYSGLYHI